MFNFGFRLFLSFNSTSLIIIIFLIKNGYSIVCFPVFETIKEKCLLYGVLKISFYFSYFIIPISLTFISIWLCGYLGKDNFEKNSIVSISNANNNFLPSYLGYFFVSLGISDGCTLVVVYVVVFIFTFVSQALYFNPLFLLLRYEFYNVSTKSGVEIFLISNKKYKVPSDIEIDKVFRINDYTFIEKKERK